MSGAHDTLVVMTRLPVPGRTKTRLIPALGEEGAATLQAEMTRHTLREARAVAARTGTRIEVRVEGGTPREARALFGDGDVRYLPQSDGDLGARMRSAIEHAFSTGATRVLVVGCDCPDLTATRMLDGFAALDGASIVLGPAADGGYYLLGLRSDAVQPALHAATTGIDWGTDKVLVQTLAALERAGVSVPGQLASLTDVDTPDDLPAWERWSIPPRSLTVVVAARNDAEMLRGLLPRLTRAAAEAAPNAVEVVVADGGSTDGTVEIARSAGVRVISTDGGRAAQLDAGAAAASGEALLFLHADTLPPDGFASAALRALADPEVTLGAFTFATDWDTATMRLLARNTRWRGRRFGMPYGDQGLFVRATTFASLGGFPSLPVMDDYEFVRRARRVGRVLVLPTVATTSARRWRAVGPWRWTALNVATTIAYRAGVSPDRLAEWRRAVVSRASQRHSKR